MTRTANAGLCFLTRCWCWLMAQPQMMRLLCKGIGQALGDSAIFTIRPAGDKEVS